MSKRGIALEVDEWSCIFNEAIPGQCNGYDCGVFLIAIIHCIYQNGGINDHSFLQSAMPELRIFYCLLCLRGNYNLNNF